MSLTECYAALRGSYEEVLSRLSSERLVKKFVLKFLTDPSYDLLVRSMESEDWPEAFRAAHTLKGVSQDLSFTKLYQSSHAITEALRTKDYDLAAQLLSKVKADYQQTADAIRAFQGG